MEIPRSTWCHLPKSAWVDIEFQDLSYTVPQGKKGSKLILRSVNGHFKSNELTAILGPSGAGKSTLLNILAGYKCRTATGEILINGKPRNLKAFRESSRYIMQEDLMQPMLTVNEAMMVAADLKLGRTVSRDDKQRSIAPCKMLELLWLWGRKRAEEFSRLLRFMFQFGIPNTKAFFTVPIEKITEILELLRLGNTAHTKTTELSGGEKKRLSIALELVNNPPVLFLDEPTTGLDDLSCAQCVTLLKQIAQGGRTIICSIHTPSAKMFSVFDNVYIMSAGQCIYQGYGPEVVPFLAGVGLECPKHFSPADFIIEVACQEYGNFQDRLVSAIDNGRNLYTFQSNTENRSLPEKSEMSRNGDFQVLEQDGPFTCRKSSWVMQFSILLMRMWKQMWRDKCYLVLRTVLHILIGCLVGNLYLGMGKDGSKTIFNFGFYFTCIIFFMYIPMMPVLLQFPKEYHMIKREHFNKWYRLSAYFAALTTSTLPVQLCLGSLYIMMVYLLTDQPMELGRLGTFYAICMLTGIISESFGLLIASQLSLVNAMFVGPVLAVPFMLLAVYGFGSGYDSIPRLIKFAMYFSYLRYSLEGLIHTMLTNREKLDCPENEQFCIYTNLDYFVKEMGMENTMVWLDITMLLLIYVIFRAGFYYLLRQRLSPNKTFIALDYIGRLVKSHIAR